MAFTAQGSRHGRRRTLLPRRPKDGQNRATTPWESGECQTNHRAQALPWSDAVRTTLAVTDPRSSRWFRSPRTGFSSTRGSALRRGEARSVSSAARDQPCLCLALFEGAARQHPRLRHRRPRSAEPRTRRPGRFRPRWSRPFAENGLGQILDFVPNHMGVGGADNPWWLDVLEWGPESDIRRLVRHRLGPGPRAICTTNCWFRSSATSMASSSKPASSALKFDRGERRALRVWAYDRHKLPICPLHYDRASSAMPIPSWSEWATSLPACRSGGRRSCRRAGELKAELARLAAQRRQRCNGAIDAAVSRAESDDLARARCPDPGPALARRVFPRRRRRHQLSPLLQHQRPRRAAHGIAGSVRPAHARSCSSCCADGTLDGLRIDHIDGLLDPKGVSASGLRARGAAARSISSSRRSSRAHERLREDWPVEGTTGYDFANLVLGAARRPGSEDGLTRALSRVYRRAPRLSPRSCGLQDPHHGERDGERAQRARPRRRRASRGRTRAPPISPATSCSARSRRVIACFPVYRTYVDGAAAPDRADRRDLDWAIGQARRDETDIDPSVFDFLHGSALDRHGRRGRAAASAAMPCCASR